MTTTKTNQELMLELAERLKTPDGAYPLRRSSEGRPPWVQVELHLETLMAALAKCGIKVSIATSEGAGESDGILWVWGTDESGLGYSKDYSYEQADPDSILNAALRASLDVVL